MGELAPIGDPPISANTPIKPLIFMREMGCVDAQYRPVRTGRCKGFKAAEGRLLRLSPAPAAQRARQDEPGHGRGAVRRPLAAVHRARQAAREEAPAGSGNIHLTEFGYQTNPPDKAIGISLAQQTKYLQQAAFVAWKSKRVRGLSFYQWDDEPVINRGSGTKRYSGWQTGLRFNNGKPKPVLSTFPAPFVIERKGKAKTVRLWGQVRAAADPTIVVQVARAARPTPRTSRR